MKKRLIAITNNKGGVGKTTTAVNLAAGLAAQGRRVLVVDADPQANATFALLGPEPPELTLADVLITRSVELPDVVTPSRTAGVDVVPSTLTLSAADLVLGGVPGREKLLARKLRAVGAYDYVLIDTPPSLGLLTVNSLTTASEIFIPVGVGTFGLLGITLLEDTIAQLKENLELDDLAITGAIATLYDHTRVARDTLDALAAHFGDRLFQTAIPRNKDVEEAHSNSTSVIIHAPNSKAAQAYVALTQEVMSHEC